MLGMSGRKLCRLSDLLVVLIIMPALTIALKKISVLDAYVFVIVTVCNFLISQSGCLSCI